MYIDTYVVAGVVIVVATVVAVSGMGYYGWKHIKEDIAKADKTADKKTNAKAKK